MGSPNVKNPISLRSKVFLNLINLGIIFFAPTVSHGVELVELKSILRDPQSFHMQEVIIQGRIQNIRNLKPYINRWKYPNSLCRGGAVIHLTDDMEHVVEVHYLGLCAADKEQQPEGFKEGEFLEARIQINSPGTYLGGGYPLSSNEESHSVKGTIMEILKH